MTPREYGAMLAASQQATEQQVEAAARILAATDVELDVAA